VIPLEDRQQLNIIPVICGFSLVQCIQLSIDSIITFKSSFIRPNN